MKTISGSKLKAHLSAKQNGKRSGRTDGRGMWIPPYSPAVKRRSMGAFPVHVKTLDALHLASARVYADASPGQTMPIFSFDTGLNRCILLTSMYRTAAFSFFP